MLIKCECCGKEFERELRHFNYNKKHNRKNLCARSCSGKMYAKRSHDKRRSKRTDIEHKLFYLFNQARHNAKTRKKDFNLDLEHIVYIWEKQGGKCPITKVSLVLKGKNGKSVPDQASIDRIDPSIGYIKGNIQIVCLFANYAKHTFDTEDVIKFFASNHSQKS